MFRFLTLFISSISLLFTGLSTDTPTFNSVEYGQENSVINNFNQEKKNAEYLTGTYSGELSLIFYDTDDNVLISIDEYVSNYYTSIWSYENKIILQDYLIKKYWVFSGFESVSGSDIVPIMFSSSVSLIADNYYNDNYIELEFYVFDDNELFSYCYDLGIFTIDFGVYSDFYDYVYLYDTQVNNNWCVSYNFLYYYALNNSEWYNAYSSGFRLLNSSFYLNGVLHCETSKPNKAYYFPYNVYISTNGINSAYVFNGSYVLNQPFNTSLSSDIAPFLFSDFKARRSGFNDYILNTSLSNVVFSNYEYSSIYIYILPTPINEPVDIWGMCLNIVSLPFTFFSQSFNVTLFEGTPYAFNLSYFFISLLAILIVILIVKIVLGIVH